MVSKAVQSGSFLDITDYIDEFLLSSIVVLALNASQVFLLATPVLLLRLQQGLVMRVAASVAGKLRSVEALEVACSKASSWSEHHLGCPFRIRISERVELGKFVLASQSVGDPTGADLTGSVVDLLEDVDLGLVAREVPRIVRLNDWLVAHFI